MEAVSQYAFPSFKTILHFPYDTVYFPFFRETT